MITRVTLADLKQKIAAASPPPLVVAAMDSRGTRYQLSTPRPTARVVGNVFSKADAECIAALWVWGQRLIEEVEERAAPPARMNSVVEMADGTKKAIPPPPLRRRRHFKPGPVVA